MKKKVIKNQQPVEAATSTCQQAEVRRLVNKSYRGLKADLQKLSKEDQIKALQVLQCFLIDELERQNFLLSEGLLESMLEFSLKNLQGYFEKVKAVLISGQTDEGERLVKYSTGEGSELLKEDTISNWVI